MRKQLRRLHQRLWRDSWTKAFAWVKVTAAGVGASLHLLATNENFRDSLSKYDQVPRWVWLALGIIGAMTWLSAEH